MLTLLCLLMGMSSAFGQRNAPSQFKAGLVTRDITPAVRRNWRGAAEHSLHVTVWYPAADTAIETPQTIGSPAQPLFRAGQAAPHAAFAPAMEPFPLVLLSHSSGASAQQMAWLGTALARAGFLAAAVDHPGNNAVTGTTAEGFLLWWERATDLSEVLDGLLADPELAPHIDRARIGAAGFSLGGTTVLELAGARSDVAPFYDLCRQAPDNASCHAPEMHDMPRGEQLLQAVRKTSGESLARSAESYRDPRLRAVFALAPALGIVLTPESLHAIRLPVELVVGAADPTAPAAANATAIKSHIRGAREVILPGVAHYTFLDSCTPAGVAALRPDCTDPPGTDRDRVHADVSALAVQFFSKVLR